MPVTLRPSRPDDADAIADIFTRSRGLLTFLPVLHTADEDRGFIRDVVMAEMDRKPAGARLLHAPRLCGGGGDGWLGQ